MNEGRKKAQIQTEANATTHKQHYSLLRLLQRELHQVGRRDLRTPYAEITKRPHWQKLHTRGLYYKQGSKQEWGNTIE